MKKLLFVITTVITFILLPYAQVLAKPGLARLNEAPVINVGQVTGTIVAEAGTASTTVQQFTVTATGLTDDVVATAPANFEIATNSNGPFSYNATLSQSGGNINAVLYVRANSSQSGIITGDVDLTATGANASATVNASVNQTVTASESTNYIFFSNCTYNWTNSNPDIGLPASGTGNINAFVAKNLTSVPVVATITAMPAPGCTGPSGSFNITVNPAPAAPSFSLTTIRHAVQVYSPLIATYGSVAAGGSSGLHGTNMQDSVYFTVTGNFEINQSGVWRQKVAVDANVINFTTAEGVEANISIRLSPNAPVGNYTGTLTISSAGISTQVYAISGTVNKAPLTVTANNATKSYGDVLTNNTASTDITTTGLQNGETITSANITYGTGAAVSAVPGTYNGTVTASSATGGNGFLTSNYNITYSSGNIIVNNRAITIKANNADKIYGASLTGSAGSGAFTVTGMPAGQTPGTITIAYGSGNSITDGVGTYPGTIIASNLTGGSFNPAYYSISYLPGDINVTPAPLTITANPGTKVFGAALANAVGSTAFTATGLLNGQTVGSVTLTYSTGATATDNVQNYNNAITPSAATGGTFTAGNYNITYVPALLAVTPALLTITLNDVSKTYGSTLSNTSNSVAFTATGLQNGNILTAIGVNYFSGASASDPVGTYAGSAVGAGINGTNGFLNSNYNTTIQPGNIVVTRASVIVKANNVSKIYGTTLTNQANSPNITVTGLQNGDSYTGATINYTAGAPANTPAGSYPGAIIPANLATIGSFLPANYNISYIAGDLTIKPAELVITASNVSKPYGNQLNNNTNSTAFTVTGLQNGEVIPDVSISYDHGGPATSAAGNYPGTVTPHLNNNGTITPANYNITYTNGDLVVTRVPLTITANTVTKIYGQVLSNSHNAAFTVTPGQIKNNELPYFLDADYGTGGLANAPVGTYKNSITISNVTGINSFVALNYDITYLPGDVIVAGVPITITANNVTKTYGATLTGAANSTAFALTSGTLINGNTLSSVTIAYGAGAAPADAMGNYNGSVMPSALVGGNGFVSANYAITYVDGKITVDRATLTITPNDQTKIFGTTLTSSAGNTNFTTTGLQNSETIESISLNYGTGAEASALVGTYTGTIVPSAPVSGTFNANNYHIIYKPSNIIVTPVPPPVITVTGNISAITTTYGTASTTIYNFNVSGIYLRDGILVTPPTGYEVSLDGVHYASVVTVGTGGTLTPTPVYIRLSTAVAAGTYLGNIELTSPQASTVYVATDVSTVTAAPLTIATTNVTKPYGDALTTTTSSTNFIITAGTLQNGNTITAVSLNYGMGAAATDGVHVYTGSVIPSAAVGTDGFIAGNYNITYTPSTLEVTPVLLTVTANRIEKIYGDVLTSGANATTFTTTGLKNGERINTATISYGSGATASSTVGIYNGAATPSAAIGANGFLATNYQFTYAAADVEVTQAPLSIAANSVAKTYGSIINNVTASNQFIATGLKNGETISGVTITNGTGAIATDAVGAYTGSVVATAASGGTFVPGNYAITYLPGNITVNAAPLVITGNSISKIYGTLLSGADGATAFTASGLLNAETIGSITNTYSAGAAANANVGVYVGAAIPSAAMGGTFNAANYTITYAPGNITVTQALLGITANNVVKTYGTTLTTSTGSTAFVASGLQNGESIGNVTITYNQGAPGNAAAGTYSGAIIADAAIGGTFSPGNYSITYTPGNVTVGKAPLTIAAINTNKTYGNVLNNNGASSAFTATGLQNAETINNVNITYAQGAAANAAPGTYTASIIPSGGTGTFVPGNYDITYVPANINVAQAVLTITANNATKTYGDVLNNTASATGFSISPLVNNETVGSIMLTYRNGAAALDAAGNYNASIMPSAVTGGTFNAANYMIIYQPGNITVKPAPLTITANNVSKEYGQVLTAESGSTAFTTAGLLNAETIGSVTLTYTAGAAASAQPGIYAGAVTAGAATGGTFNPANYNINYIPGTVTVNNPPPGITTGGNLTGLSTVYGTASASTVFTISANNLTAGALVVPPAGFEVSTDNINFSATVTAGSGGTIDSAPIYIRLNAVAAAGAYSGTIQVSSTGINATLLMPVSVINKAPLTIAALPASKVYGTLLSNELNSKNFTATGLKNAETIGTVSIGYGTGVAINAAVAIYPVSVTATAPVGGTFSLNNYNAIYLPADITVTPASLLITADNQSRSYGVANPLFTVSYSGFLNNDDATQLNKLPVTATLANTSSLPGQYPITVSGAMATNYSITYLPGILTVIPGNVTLSIPSAFTPNGDGINDTWNIMHIEAYPVKTTVDIFDRYGRKVFTSIGYGQAWDGNFSGTQLPSGTYYYIIDPKNNNKPLAGSVTLIR